MPKIDFSRLQLDIEKRRRSRATDIGQGGRLTGSMAIVREHLAKFEAMRANGASWVDIAAGLAEQGVLQRDGQPITGRRLTALVASVKREALRKSDATARRAARNDFRQEDTSPPPTRLTLSPDLADARAPGSPKRSDEERRRVALDRAKTLLKKG